MNNKGCGIDFGDNYCKICITTNEKNNLIILNDADGERKYLLKLITNFFNYIIYLLLLHMLKIHQFMVYLQKIQLIIKIIIQFSILKDY